LYGETVGTNKNHDKSDQFPSQANSYFWGGVRAEADSSRSKIKIIRDG